MKYLFSVILTVLLLVTYATYKEILYIKNFNTQAQCKNSSIDYDRIADSLELKKMIIEEVVGEFYSVRSEDCLGIYNYLPKYDIDSWRCDDEWIPFRRSSINGFKDGKIKINSVWLDASRVLFYDNYD